MMSLYRKKIDNKIIYVIVNRFLFEYMNIKINKQQKKSALFWRITKKKKLNLFNYLLYTFIWKPISHFKPYLSAKKKMTTRQNIVYETTGCIFHRLAYKLLIFVLIFPSQNFPNQTFFFSPYSIIKFSECYT